MVVRQEQRPGAPGTPAAFRAAVAAMGRATLRPEVFCEQSPAPQRIAPYSTALTADVSVDDVEVGTGRLIVLHDPAGNDAWDGTFRCVAYCRCDVEPELASDELLAGVGWDWLLDALAGHEAGYTAVSGTVTRVVTEAFGTMADDDGSAQVEIRASWTPVAGPDGVLDLATHVEAWGELLCAAAGLEPVPEGVSVLPSRRGQRDVAP